MKKNEKDTKLSKNDILILMTIVLGYAFLSFIRLGSFDNPTTFMSISKTKGAIFETDDITDITTLNLYTEREIGKYLIENSIDGKNYQYVTTFKTSGAFAWDEVPIHKKARYFKITRLSKQGVLGEVGFRNSKDQLVEINSKEKKLVDEQEKIPDKISYLNSSYFDEIYFARSAYEIVHHLPTYEWVHPPLGKIIQAIPIKLFGMAPFWYRLMGNISGILMIVVMYLLGKVWFGKTRYATISALLMTFDTFHFAQTRMGTVDSHLVLFVLLSFLFLFYYLQEKNGKYAFLHLFLSGLFFGFSISVKWTGFLGGLGLAILFFYSFIKEQDYRTFKKNQLVKTGIVCILSFIVVPIVIYCGSYYLAPQTTVRTVDSIPNLIDQTKDMYNYHSTLKASHPFTSSFFTWPFNYKPVWYYVKYQKKSRSTISGIGNIAIWWVGVVALIYLIYKILRHKDSKAFSIMICYVSLWIPYLLIGRIMFLYHYFLALPFMIFAIVLLLKDICEKTGWKWFIPCYLGIVIIFFVLYYPVASGMEMSNHYLDFLRILKSWMF